MENVDEVWNMHGHAIAFLESFLDECCRANPMIASLRQEIQEHTNTLLFNWIDYFLIGESPIVIQKLEELGFQRMQDEEKYTLYHPPIPSVPRVVVGRLANRAEGGIALSVGHIKDFLMTHGLQAEIAGIPYGQFRRCCATTENGVSLWVIERRGTSSIEPSREQSGYLESFLGMCEMWDMRPRGQQDEMAAMRNACYIAEKLVSTLGQDLAAWVIMEGERKYWHLHNRAAQIQKQRQDGLGLGWDNRNFHAFRSSRRFFPMLVRMFERLGFHCRERLYDISEERGTQIMENGNAGFIVFLQTDLQPKEGELDFGHQWLPELDQLGTIELWCALRGDSILRGGIHHVETRFLLKPTVQECLLKEEPQSLSSLKQSFTEGKPLHVTQEEVQALLNRGRITPKQADSLSVRTSMFV